MLRIPPPMTLLSSDNLQPDTLHSSMGDSYLLCDSRDGVVTLTLNRPLQYNALSRGLIRELQDALDAIGADRAVKVVVLAANGPGFCSGHDLREIRALPDRVAVEALFLECSKMMMTLTGIAQPVIAKIHGVATAAGCQLVAACDLAVASTSAKFSTPGVNIGAFCATPSVALARNVSRKHAMEMLLTGEMINAQRAVEMGLINRAVQPEALDTEVDRLANLIASKSSAAIASGKRVFYQHLEMGVAQAYVLASHSIAGDFVSPDGQEGVDAFLTKRPPQWS